MGTTKNGLPYPEPTDPVADGADAIKALALKIDPRLPLAILAGNISFPSTAANSSSSVDVKFPDGVFTGTPAVVISPSSSAPSIRFVSVSAPSKSGFTGVYFNAGSSAAGVGAWWIAVQAPVLS